MPTANGRKIEPGPATTRKYKRNRAQDVWCEPRTLPRLSWKVITEMLHDPIIRLGLKMKSAPLHMAEFAFQEGEEWTPGIRATSPEVSAFVLMHFKKIWQRYLRQICTAQISGWAAFEVTFKIKRGRLVLDKMLHRHAQDSSPLLKDGELEAVEFRNIADVGKIRVFRPYVLWHAYQRQEGSPWGRSVLRGALAPWADKSTEGGALDIRRLFMYKDAYAGMNMGYPEGVAEVEGRQVPNQDIAREILDHAATGHSFAKPSERDADGNELWPVQYAQIPNNPTHILQFPKDLDTEILRGLEIPDDVLTSEATGAWQGKQVPMLAFFVSAEEWLSDVISDIREFFLDDLVCENFGPDAGYEVETKPLAEVAMEMMSESNSQEQVQVPQLPVPQQEPPRQQQQLGLEEAVGAGVMHVGRLIKAADVYFEDKKEPEDSAPVEVQEDTTDYAAVNAAIAAAGLTDDEAEALRGVMR